jgi:hypothetical protein
MSSIYLIKFAFLKKTIFSRFLLVVQLEGRKMFDDVELMNERTPLTSSVFKTEKEKIVLDLIQRFHLEEIKLKRKYLLSSICQLSVSTILFLIIILVIVIVVQLPISGKLSNFNISLSNGRWNVVYCF